MIAAAFVTGIAAVAQQKVDDVIKIKTEKHDFGKIKQNVPVTTSFEITNISDKPVVVENSWGACGCTTPEKIVEPIAPGATAKLKVSYNAAALAPFENEVYIKLAGVQEPKIVMIKGEVLDAAAYDTYVKSNGNKSKAKDDTKKLKGAK